MGFVWGDMCVPVTYLDHLVPTFPPGFMGEDFSVFILLYASLCYFFKILHIIDDVIFVFLCLVFLGHHDVLWIHSFFCKGQNVSVS